MAILFSRRSSWSRDWAPVSFIAGRFFTTEPPESFNYTHIYIYFICLMRYIYDYNWKWRVASQGWRVLTLPLQSAVRVLLSSFQPCPSFSAHTFWLKCQALSLFRALGLSVWLTSLLQRKVHQTIHYRDLSGNTPYEQLVQNTSPVSMHFTP